MIGLTLISKVGVGDDRFKVILGEKRVWVMR